MLRVLFNEVGAAPWLLTEDEFLEHIGALAQRGFVGVPVGRVSVEAIDELDRIQWRAYYPNTAALAILAREIRQGRDAVARRGA